MTDDRDTRFVLTIDLGTGGPKVGYTTLSGHVVWSEHATVETRFLDGGGAVQDAEHWWRVILDVARRGLDGGEVRPERVVAVSTTGQWASTVPVDDTGRPVGDCVMWMDGRGGRAARRVFGGPVSGYHPRKLVEWVRRSGGAPSLAGADAMGHHLFLREHEPEVWRAARWLLEPVDYLGLRFSGVAAATPASMTAAWLTDNRATDIVDYDPVLVRLSTVDPDKLPPLRPTGSVIGIVQPSVARDLGLRDDVVVVAGTPDLHSALLGSGAVGDFEAHATISTTSWISCHVPFKKTDVFHQIASLPGLFPGRYAIVDNQDTAGLALQWARDALLGVDDFTAVTTLAAAAPPGSNGVVFTPWLQGERSPVDDRHARGGFHNLSLATTQADLARAVLEGVAYNSRWLLGVVEKFAGRRLDPIRFIGGGAQSELWLQVQADVLDRTVERVADPLFAHLRGAALLAAITLGAVEVREVRDLVPTDAVFRPDPANRAVYDALAAEVPVLYRAQRKLFRRLNSSRVRDARDG